MIIISDFPQMSNFFVKQWIILHLQAPGSVIKTLFESLKCSKLLLTALACWLGAAIQHSTSCGAVNAGDAAKDPCFLL